MANEDKIRIRFPCFAETSIDLKIRGYGNGANVFYCGKSADVFGCWIICERLERLLDNPHH